MTTQPARKLREVLKPGDPVSLTEAASLTGDVPEKVSASLTRLAEQGLFLKVRQRLWVRAGVPVNPYRLGSRVTSPYAFSYGTALVLHGAAASERSEVLVSSPHRFDAFEFEGFLYRHTRPWSEHGRVRVSVGEQFVWVTSPERTLVECVRVPSNAGGVAELLRSVSALPELDPDAVLRWVDHYGEPAVASRLGYLLQASDRPEREARVLAALERRRPSFRAYFDPGTRRGKLVSRWNLLVPHELLESRR
jgi:predicted transcriptional regulator of viral defense system